MISTKKIKNATNTTEDKAYMNSALANFSISLEENILANINAKAENENEMKTAMATIASHGNCEDHRVARLVAGIDVNAAIIGIILLPQIILHTSEMSSSLPNNVDRAFIAVDTMVKSNNGRTIPAINDASARRYKLIKSEITGMYVLEPI
jgi:hypothetical protein